MTRLKRRMKIMAQEGEMIVSSQRWHVVAKTSETFPGKMFVFVLGPLGGPKCEIRVSAAEAREISAMLQELANDLDANDA